MLGHIKNGQSLRFWTINRGSNWSVRICTYIVDADLGPTVPCHGHFSGEPCWLDLVGQACSTPTTVWVWVHAYISQTCGSQLSTPQSLTTLLRHSFVRCSDGRFLNIGRVLPQIGWFTKKWKSWYTPKSPFGPFRFEDLLGHPKQPHWGASWRIVGPTHLRLGRIARDSQRWFGGKCRWMLLVDHLLLVKKMANR